MKHTYNHCKLKTFRRRLRLYGTPAEASLWKIIQNRQVDGWRFARQYSVANYILDFYCSKLRFAIELDGDYHDYFDQPLHDYKRDQYLIQHHDIRVARFENKVVYEQPEIIIEAIRQRARELSR